MKELQITLICLLAALGIAFVVMLFVKFNENPLFRIKPSKKRIEKIVDILKQNDLPSVQWNNIWPIFYKNGEINFERIEIVFLHIINDSQYGSVHDRAIVLFQEYVSVAVYGDTEITEAIFEFRDTLKQCGHQKVKESGNILIDKVQRYCKSNRNHSKYDIIIQWIFNAIEIVGFILAIITL